MGLMQTIKHFYESKKHLVTSDLPSSDRRLIMVFRFVQFTIVFGMINMLIKSISEAINDYFSIILLLSFALFFVEYITKLLKRGEKRKTVNLFFGIGSPHFSHQDIAGSSGHLQRYHFGVSRLSWAATVPPTSLGDP